MRYKNADSTSKFSTFPSFLFNDCTPYCFYLFTNCVLLLFFLWSLFRSRSYPVPHRGERVKQRAVHPRNFDFFTLKDRFMIFIIPGCYNSVSLPSELTCSDAYFNPLQTKRRPLHLKTQSVPRCKHFSSRL